MQSIMKFKFPTKKKNIISVLNNFCDEELSSYERNRNFDFGPPHRNVSTLSPFIRKRLITELDVIATALKKHEIDKIEKFIQEVFWGTYWRGWLELHPSVYQSLDDCKQEIIIPEKTGIKCFDFWTEELIETGYLHNHARMWYASIWVFTLKKPWMSGAKFFKQNLLDWCPASNTLGWRWVAGLQTIGKHYVAKPENIKFFTNNRFYPINQLVRNPMPFTDNNLTGKSIKFNPPDIINFQQHDQIGLVLTKNDLSIDTFFKKKGVPFKGTIFFKEEIDVNKSSVVNNFEKEIMHSLADESPMNKLIHNIDQLVNWAKNAKVNKVIFPYETVGNELLNIKTLIDKLKDVNITPIFFMRDWDRYAFPFANKGFFQFKKKIPYLLQKNNLTKK